MSQLRIIYHPHFKNSSQLSILGMGVILTTLLIVNSTGFVSNRIIFWKIRSAMKITDRSRP